MKKANINMFQGRRYLALALILLIFMVLFMRAIQLQWLEADFYEQKGVKTQVGVVEMPAHRGVINDRFGEALAISTPVYSISANPRVIKHNSHSIKLAATILQLDEAQLFHKIQQRADKYFVYLKRHVPPDVAEAIQEQALAGISVSEEYRRYYPAGEMLAHVVGLTNIDGKGIEGIEHAYDDWLHGEPGSKRVIKDGRRQVIADVELIESAKEGRELQLSIDKRIQYLAYRELRKALKKHVAKSGSVVVLSVDTGEILAMTNLPVFNPNDRRYTKHDEMRNRAITDRFEPGSTIKPFLIAAKLESDFDQIKSQIDTAPGSYQYGELEVKDARDYGRIGLSTLVAKSSNVGAVKIALSMDPAQIWSVYQGVGFGQLSGSGITGENEGELKNHTEWNKLQHATIAYGYGLSATTLQLARAYSVFANRGILYPVSFIAQQESPQGVRVMSSQTAQAVLHMMQSVVSAGGTGSRARMKAYSSAGKTGTSKKSIEGGYSDTNYVALFAGLAPFKQPKIVVVVMVDTPTRNGYSGGQVAAPVFANIAEGALRLMNIVPDQINADEGQMVLAEGGIK